MSRPRVVLRADAGREAGLGHVRRCLTLAQALTASGIDPLLVTPDGHAGRLLRAQGLPAATLTAEPGSDADLMATARIAARSDAAAVVVDSYAAGRPYLDELALRHPRLVVLDDLCAFPFSARLVVNGRLGAEDDPYEASREGTGFLLGAEYALLRRELWSGAPGRAPGHDVPRVVITAGGSDPASLTSVALRALELLDRPLEIAAIVGPLAGRPALPPRPRHRPGLYVDPPDPIALMASAEAAISAGGGMLVELAAAGTPAVAVEVAPNQRPGLDALAAAGACVDAGRIDDAELVARIAGLVAALLASPQRRAAMSAAGRALYDGQGALRVARRIAELVHSGRPQPDPQEFLTAGRSLGR
jgi:spore coat polysaccharide biosynthesis protein SpsF